MDKNIKLKLKSLMTNFVTFGSDSYYQGLAKKTLSQFNGIYKNSNTKLYTSSDLTQEVLENAKKYRRGFGYYFWKPFVYNLMITESKDGEVSLYFDSRSGISDKFFDKFILKIKKMNWFNTFLENEKYDIAAWQTNFEENQWTTGDIFNLFSLNLDSPHAATGHYTDIFFSVRKNKKTLAFFENLQKVTEANSYIFSPNDSKLENSKNFVESRYVQSLFSLMLKINEQDLNIFNINPEDITSSKSILPHRYMHEGNKINLT